MVVGVPQPIPYHALGQEVHQAAHPQQTQSQEDHPAPQTQLQPHVDLGLQGRAEGGKGVSSRLLLGYCTGHREYYIGYEGYYTGY